MLINRTYLGEIGHKSAWYPGQHPALIDQKTWDEAQAILATNGRVRACNTRAQTPFLLKGLVFGGDGRALAPWHTTKKKTGRVYRYYVSQRDLKEHAGASGLPRLPAAELESAVLEQLRSVLRSPGMIREVVPKAIALDPTLDEAMVTVGLTRLDAIWDELFPLEQHRLVSLLIEKIVVTPNELEVRMRTNGIERVLLELNTPRTESKVAA